ncbi:MAG: pH regulation protein F [Spirochaetaceae bacterium]|nr:MAG: pH regulation protein F [Spirochaetaceae bacterium]
MVSFYDAVLLALALLTIGGIIRVVVGPTIWDRLLGLNLISSKIIMAIIVFALMIQRTFLLDIAIVYALLGFIGSVLIARFIERKGE